MDKVYGLRKEIENYFELQAEILLRDSRASAALTKHRGQFGLAGEEAVRTFLRKHLPGRYGVGTGHIVSYNETSSQVDIVLYDSQECFKIPITAESTLFSIEGVYSAIEVKSSPSRNRSTKFIKEAVLNIASVNRIQMPPFSYYGGLIPPKVPPTRFKDFAVVMQKTLLEIMNPIGAILILGTGVKFNTIVKNFLQEHKLARVIPPRLLCVIDEKEFGLCGFDLIIEDKKTSYKFWRDTCRSAGQTLASFLYWLTHYMTFNRVIEQPIISNENMEGIWPSVLAPVAPRIKVSVSETGNQRSWPWLNETRKFEPDNNF